MNLSVTFRHMEATEALKDYVRERLEKLKRYFGGPASAHVVLATERGYQHLADINIALSNGIALKGREQTEDMYSSIDLALAKIERQVRKYKERIRDHKPHHGPEVPIRAFVYSAESLVEVDGESRKQRPASAAPLGVVATPGKAVPAPVAAAKPQAQVIKSSEFVARPMGVEQAVMQMDLLHNDFLVFMNTASSQVSVLYRRNDGNYGLIEAGSVPSGPSDKT